MNNRINNLRLDAGISQLKDDPRLVVIDREGNVIDPLIGLEKFAELIIRDCMDVVDGYTKGRTFDTHYDAVVQIETLFGIKHNRDDE